MDNERSPALAVADGVYYGQGWTCWFYGVHPEQVALLAVGQVFGMVSSPHPFSTGVYWNYAILQVVLSEVRGEVSRMYREVARRDLETWEVECFERIGGTMSEQTYFIQVNLISPSYVREHKLSLLNLPPGGIPGDAQEVMRFRSIYECLSTLDQYQPTDCVKTDHFPKITAVMGRYDKNPESVFMWLFSAYRQYDNPIQSWIRAMEGRGWVDGEKWDYDLTEFPEWGKWTQGDDPIQQYDPAALKKLVWWLWDRLAPKQRNN